MSKILVCTMAENLPFKKLTKRYIKRYADAHGFGFYYHNSQTTLPSLKKMIRDSPGSNERLKMRASYLAAKFDLIKLAADSSDLWVVWVDGDILISKDADSIAPTLVDKNVLYGRLYFEEDNFCGGRNQWVKNLKLPTNERPVSYTHLTLPTSPHV